MSNYIPNVEEIYRDRILYVKEMEIYLENLKKQKENKSMSNTTNFEKVLGKKNANVGEAIVNAKADLGKSLKDSLVDVCDKFAQWTEANQIVLEAFNDMKVCVETIKELDNTMVEMQKVSEDTIKQLNNEYCLDVVEIDLNDAGYDVNQWEEDVKPVKAIISICIPSCSNYKTDTYDMELVGHLVFLMEDGTFRMNQ